MNQLRFRTIKALLVFILLVVGAVYKTPVFAETKKIILATAEWDPYISQTKTGHGQFSEIVTHVFKEMGIETEYMFAPWKRVEALVKQGQAFAAIPYSYTEKRHQIFDYSVPIMNSSYVFFYNKKTHPQGINYDKLEDLAAYHIGGVTGYWYDELFAKAKLTIEYVTTDDQCINKLYVNRVDLIASDELVGWSLIKKLYPNEMNQFGVIPKPFGTQYLHLMVSRNYPNAPLLTQKFNETFKNLYDKKVFEIPQLINFQQ